MYSSGYWGHRAKKQPEIQGKRGISKEMLGKSVGSLADTGWMKTPDTTHAGVKNSATVLNKLLNVKGNHVGSSDIWGFPLAQRVSPWPLSQVLMWQSGEERRQQLLKKRDLSVSFCSTKRKPWDVRGEAASLPPWWHRRQPTASQEESKEEENTSSLVKGRKPFGVWVPIQITSKVFCFLEGVQNSSAQDWQRHHSVWLAWTEGAGSQRMPPIQGLGTRDHWDRS